MISEIIITLVFIAVVILIFLNKISRAIVALTGAVIVYFTLIIDQRADFSDFTSFLLGGADFANLHALILILGILFIVQVCISGGVFQFIAFKLIQMTKGKPNNLLLVFSLLAVLLGATLGNVLSVFVLIPLTIVATRILNINHSPYIIAEAILVNVGSMVFSISSIPNILITTYADISLIDFFINVGLYSFVLFAITMVFLHYYYRNRFVAPQKKFIDILLSYNVWNYVSDRKLFYKSLITFLAVLICLITIPSAIIPPDMIALSGAIILLIISRLDGKEIIKKIDLELLLYLMGIFIITGAMNAVGVIDQLAAGISSLTGGNVFATILAILWISAFLSSSIDNIPITQVLIPVVSDITTVYHFSAVATDSAYYSLAWGTNLGDNLTPMGDNIIVMNLAEQNERPISFREFFKLGFIATILQLTAVSVYFIIINNLNIGIFVIFIIIMIVISTILFFYLRSSNKSEESLIINNILRKISNPKYRREKRLIFQQFIRKIIRIVSIKTKKQVVLSILRSIKQFFKELM